MFNCGPVYYANAQSTADIVINQGGTDSGKTYALIQLAFVLAITTRAPKDDAVITVLSESVPNSKKGAYRIGKAVYNTEGVAQYVKEWNHSDRVITFKSGWQIEFVGATDEQNAKQGKRQYLIVNEANGISWEIFWQYAKRTRIRTWIDYNPSAPFWAHDKLIGTTPDSNELSAVVQLIISDHRHNPFLSEKDHAKTEGIKDPELWRVYARGLTGNLSGLVFPNWKQIPDKQFPWTNDLIFGGLDFGYTNDPTGAVTMARIANKIFIHELCYEPGITNIKLVKLYQAANYDEDTPVYCEHDPDAIRQLRELGLLSIAARKGNGSIKAGIQKVNEYEIFYTASSTNIDFERKRYMYDKDKTTGKTLNYPVDQYNHLMDAIRYGIYSHFFRQD